MFFIPNQNHFKTLIQNEEIKASYEKSDLLKPDYLLLQENDLSIYYAPFEYINKEAKVIFVGITPGWYQMEMAFKTVIQESQNNTWEEATKKVRQKASLSGPLRKNLVSMLDEIGLNKKLTISSCSQLFAEKSNFLHTTSMLKYPIFMKNKNYTGTTPSPIKNKILWDFILNRFVPEINNFENRLIIPLGKSVHSVLEKLLKEGLISSSNTILYNFPHPSGANGHRKRIFEENKHEMKRLIENWNY